MDEAHRTGIGELPLVYLGFPCQTYKDMILCAQVRAIYCNTAPGIHRSDGNNDYRPSGFMCLSARRPNFVHGFGTARYRQHTRLWRTAMRHMSLLEISNIRCSSYSGDIVQEDSEKLMPPREPCKS